MGRKEKKVVFYSLNLPTSGVACNPTMMGFERQESS
jgi:hypothetical protein